MFTQNLNRTNTGPASLQNRRYFFSVLGELRARRVEPIVRLVLHVRLGFRARSPRKLKKKITPVLQAKGL